MADYWKSQDKKFCDFCKCWIADNKPSRDFHENGKRHKENVKKRLKSITKDSAKTQREEQKVDGYIKQMEAAAIEAYRKDVEHNADLTSMAINKKLQEDNLVISETSSKKVWHELVSKEGHTYFWNTLTSETKWEPPEEGYLSINEQREEKDKDTVRQLKEVDKYKQREGLTRIEEQKQEAEEERARLEREKLKERRVREPSPPPVYGPLFDTRKTDAYGTWAVIKPSEPIDLQLPETAQQFECPVFYEPEPVVKEFKEKTVTCSQQGESSSGFSFKKRKIQTGAKKNARQRLDDN